MVRPSSSLAGDSADGNGVPDSGACLQPLGSSSQPEEDAAQPSVLAAPASSDGMHDVDSDGDRCVGGDRRYDAEEGSLDGE